VRLVEENKKHRIEYCDFNIQLDQRSQAVDRFSEIDWLGVQIQFIDFSIQPLGSAKRFECGVMERLRRCGMTPWWFVAFTLLHHKPHSLVNWPLNTNASRPYHH
jgi:hypothetical protein